MAQAIDITKVSSVKNDIHRDIIVTMSAATNADIQRLGVNILRGVEHRDSKFVYKGFQQVASQYQPGNTPRARLGKVIERELVVKNAIVYVPDNVQNYRTMEPESMLGTSSNGVDGTAIIQARLLYQATQFGNQVAKNFFHGDYSKGVADPYGLYDGILVKIAADKTNGYINSAAGNYITLGSINLNDPVACYDAYIKFVKKLHSDLRKKVKIYTTEEMESAIIRGYGLKFNYLQSEVAASETFKSFEARGAELISTTLLGTGTGFIATADGNIDYATDLTGSESPSDAYICVEKDNTDPLNSVLLGMQCASGTRIIDFNPQRFAVSDYSFTPETIADQTLEYVDEHGNPVDANGDPIVPDPEP